MKRSSLAASLVAAVVVVLALSSCAPAVHPPSAPTAHSHATAKPHPHATQAATPSVRVPVKCGSLLTDGAAATIIQSPIKEHVDQTTQPVDITDVTARQYGSLRCLWGGDREDSGYDQYLSIDVTPDAAAGYAANADNFGNTASEDPPTTLNTVGDRSAYGCAVDAGLHCTANMLVGSFWVTVYVQNLGQPQVTQAIAGSQVQSILTTAAAALSKVNAAKAWTPPAGTLPTFCTAAGSATQVNAALGVSDFVVVNSDDEVSDAASYTEQPTVYTQCTWGSSGAPNSAFTYLSIAMLRGGAWVLPELPGERNAKSYMLGSYAPMSVPGATAAAGDCSSDADQCEVAISLGSLLVVIDMDDPGDAQATGALARIVADIKAS